MPLEVGRPKARPLTMCLNISNMSIVLVTFKLNIFHFPVWNTKSPYSDLEDRVHITRVRFLKALQGTWWLSETGTQAPSPFRAPSCLMEASCTRYACLYSQALPSAFLHTHTAASHSGLPGPGTGGRFHLPETQRKGRHRPKSGLRELWEENCGVLGIRSMV